MTVMVMLRLHTLDLLYHLIYPGEKLFLLLEERLTLRDNASPRFLQLGCFSRRCRHEIHQGEELALSLNVMVSVILVKDG